MRRAAWAFVTVSVVGLVAVSFDSSCADPGQLCRGTSINRSFEPGTTTPARACTECVEATCCDLIGDCQGTACALEVADTHACVLDAGRRAASKESECRDALRSPQSKVVYQCMRDNCDDECKLPTCRLDPLVPSLGENKCDRCFAQSCCSLMNQCAKNRTCLLTLNCIVDRCRGDFARQLSVSEHAEALMRMANACDGGDPTGGGPGGNGPPDGNCFGSCINDYFVPNSEEAIEARCIAAQINECGSSAGVNCGDECRLDAALDAPDAGAADASDDASDAGAD